MKETEGQMLNHLFDFSLLAAILLPFTRGCATDMSAVTPVGLKTEMMAEPLGLDTARPRFSWRVEDARPGACQTAYQIQAASSAENLDRADLWDSGKIGSNQSHLVKYAGKPLVSRQRVWWRV